MTAGFSEGQGSAPQIFWPMGYWCAFHFLICFWSSLIKFLTEHLLENHKHRSIRGIILQSRPHLSQWHLLTPSLNSPPKLCRVTWQWGRCSSKCYVSLPCLILCNWYHLLQTKVLIVCLHGGTWTTSRTTSTRTLWMDPSGKIYLRWSLNSPFMYLFTGSPSWQICVPVMQNILVESSSCGQLLLCCIRAYVELDVLALFDIHTDEIIAFGRGVADKFVKLANVSHLPKILGIVIANLTWTTGIWSRELEFPQDAPHQTLVWWHRGQRCYKKLHLENLRKDARSFEGLLQLAHEL